jgi:hypothetical protein
VKGIDRVVLEQQQQCFGLDVRMKCSSTSLHFILQHLQYPAPRIEASKPSQQAI